MRVILAFILIIMIHSKELAKFGEFQMNSEIITISQYKYYTQKQNFNIRELFDEYEFETNQ